MATLNGRVFPGQTIRATWTTTPNINDWIGLDHRFVNWFAGVCNWGVKFESILRFIFHPIFVP
jgi:hypothetical protein